MIYTKSGVCVIWGKWGEIPVCMRNMGCVIWEEWGEMPVLYYEKWGVSYGENGCEGSLEEFLEARQYGGRVGMDHQAEAVEGVLLG